MVDDGDARGAHGLDTGPIHAIASISTSISGSASGAWTVVRAGGSVVKKVAKHVVHRLEVADVGEVDVALEDVVERRAALAQHRLDVRQHLLGLRGRIAESDEPAVLVPGHLPGGVDQAAGGAAR